MSRFVHSMRSHLLETLSGDVAGTPHWVKNIEAGGADSYAREWSKAGELVGVENPPRSERELRAARHSFNADGILKHDDSVEETITFLRIPPLSCRELASESRQYALV